MEKTNFRITGGSIILLLILLITQPCIAQNWDIDLLKSINQNHNKSLQGVTVDLTNSVYPISGITPVTELIIGYKKKDSALIAGSWQTIAGLGVNFVFTFGLKYAVDRPRPYVTYSFIQPYQHDKDPSFPSGHSSFSFNTATSLFIVCPKWYVGVIAYSWSAAVAYSRMALGMHYPSDVFAGALVGAGSAYLSYKGNKWIIHHSKKNQHTIEH